jgi:DUF1365 family protein
MSTPSSAAGCSIVFGTVRHRRMRPRLHAFAYPVFFLRLPMRTMQRAPLETRLFGIEARRLFRVCQKDYGRRDGSSVLALIDGVLAEHGISDATGEVWLQTFPRVFNYVFNPISIWFCHRPDGALRAVVCEVNNTFGESHSYLLFHDDGRPIADGEALSANKVFHVSPFCKVEGHYVFRFINTKERSVARIDYDDAAGPIIYTSISGTVKQLSDRALVRALLRYPGFTFGVVARIHWQALKLFAKRIPFFSKPPAPVVEVTR